MTEHIDSSAGTSSRRGPKQADGPSGLEIRIAGPAPDLSVHFFDHHGGDKPSDEPSPEYHLVTVSIPGYHWEHDTALQIARHVRRVSELAWDRVHCGLCYTIGYTDLGLPAHGHGPVAEGAHATALKEACDLFIYDAIAAEDVNQGPDPVA